MNMLINYNNRVNIKNLIKIIDSHHIWCYTCIKKRGLQKYCIKEVFGMKCRKYNNQLDKLKLWFLEDMVLNGYDEVTVRNFENFMYRIRRFEVEWMSEKPIHEYNFEEILFFLKNLNSKSQESLVSYLNMIRRYFQFCKRESKMDDTIDFFKNIKPEQLADCVNTRKSRNRYITRKKLKNIIDGFINDTDKAFLLLMFEGISGKENSEILNLKKEDVDLENNTIKTVRNDKEVIIPISEELADILDRVIETDIVYYENNYDSRVDILEGSEYVFRPTVRFLNLDATKQRIEDGEYNGRQMDLKTLTSRVHKLIKLYSDMQYITSISLIKSGIVCRAIEEIGLNAEKQIFAEWVEMHEGYSTSISYKMYKVYLDIVEEMKKEIIYTAVEKIDLGAEKDKFEEFIDTREDYWYSVKEELYSMYTKVDNTIVQNIIELIGLDKNFEKFKNSVMPYGVKNIDKINMMYEMYIKECNKHKNKQ